MADCQHEKRRWSEKQSIWFCESCLNECSPPDLAAKKERTDTCAECVRLQARIAELEATVKSLAFTVVSKPK